ncbi:hypothetical protein Syun_015490 [Stephania yunnanensis]|uniref:RRM domain-containing protein n=1 Tax=Stephania yunnanensis TaxID=152371 RepID=A0AAP0JM45_9MAGN
MPSAVGPSPSPSSSRSLVATAAPTVRPHRFTRAVDGSKDLYVGRAQKKAEREQMIRRQVEERKKSDLHKYEESKVFVKNVSDDVDDVELQEKFSKFVKVTSAKIMGDETGASNGFAFVCLSNPEEAYKAVSYFNGAKASLGEMDEASHTKRQGLGMSRARLALKSKKKKLVETTHQPDGVGTTPEEIPIMYGVHHGSEAFGELLPIASPRPSQALLLLRLHPRSRRRRRRKPRSDRNERRPRNGERTWFSKATTHVAMTDSITALNTK